MRETWRTVPGRELEEAPRTERDTAMEVLERGGVVQRKEVADARRTLVQSLVAVRRMVVGMAKETRSASSPKLDPVMVRVWPPSGSRSVLGSTEESCGRV